MQDQNTKGDSFLPFIVVGKRWSNLRDYSLMGLEMYHVEQLTPAQLLPVIVTPHRKFKKKTFQAGERVSSIHYRQCDH